MIEYGCSLISLSLHIYILTSICSKHKLPDPMSSPREPRWREHDAAASHGCHDLPLEPGSSWRKWG